MFDCLPPGSACRCPAPGCGTIKGFLGVQAGTADGLFTTVIHGDDFVSASAQKLLGADRLRGLCCAALVCGCGRNPHVLASSETFRFHLETTNVYTPASSSAALAISLSAVAWTSENRWYLHSTCGFR